MTSAGFPKPEKPVRHVELRTGTPYANLIANQRLFAAAVGEHFKANPADILPMTGTTGAIEAVRNHVFRTSRKSAPSILTVCPGYWRARESFTGFGFEVIDLKTEPLDFTIDEDTFVQKARKERPDLIYLSLPNNPTGAVFDPKIVITGAPETSAVMIDLTLPSRDIDARGLTARLYQNFRARRNLYLAGSTSKSHETAEHRVGWLVCAHSEDAEQLRKENRNVVASAPIQEALARLATPPTALGLIEESFRLLKEAEKPGRFNIVMPKRMTETGYVLIRSHVPAEEIRRLLADNRINVMWGSEFGLADEYIRLETLEPGNIKVFAAVVNACQVSIQP